MCSNLMAMKNINSESQTFKSDPSHFARGLYLAEDHIPTYVYTA